MAGRQQQGRQQGEPLGVPGQAVWTPTPDPTVLTTQQLREAMGALKELLETKVECIRETFGTRLSGMDQAIKLLEKATSEAHMSVRRQVQNLKDQHDETFKLHLEKFRGVEETFKGWDARTDKIAELNQKAIDAALQAAKELVGVQAKSNEQTNAKTETGLVKQIEGIVDLVKTNAQNANDKTEANAQNANGKIDDMKERLASLDNRITSVEARKAGGGDAWGYLIGFGGLVALAAAAVVGVVALFVHR